MIAGIGCRHFESLARIDKKPDFKFIPALVLAVKLEAVEGPVLVAGRAEDNRLVFFCAGLVGKNIELHCFISIHCFGAGHPGPPLSLCPIYPALATPTR